jgi:nitroreductase
MPERLDVIAVMPFGYPAKANASPKKNRRPFSEVVHRERFGQPLAG